MYTYDTSYYGYPLDDKFFNSASQEAIEFVEEAYESQIGWVNSAYHGGSSRNPMWVGIDVSMIGEAWAENHCRLKDYVKTPTEQEKQTTQNEFEKLWKGVPDLVRFELEKIFGQPDYWVVEVSS